MTTIHVQPVIMAGGSGTRLWPLSRAQYPKQFLVLQQGNRSLFQQAAQRLSNIGTDAISVAVHYILHVYMCTCLICNVSYLCIYM